MRTKLLFNKVTAWLLTLVIMITLMPIAVFAEDGDISLYVSSPIGKSTELTISGNSTFAELKSKIEAVFNISFEDDGYGIYCSDAKIYYDYKQPEDTKTLAELGFKSGYKVYAEKNLWTATEENPIKIFGLTITGGTGCCEPYGDYSNADYYWNYHYKTIMLSSAAKNSNIVISGTADSDAYFISKGKSYVTFDGVTMSNDSESCITLNANAKLYLCLKGNNTLTTTGGETPTIVLNNSDSKLLVYDWSDYKTDDGYGGGTLTVNSMVSGVPAIGTDPAGTAETDGVSIAYSAFVTANGGANAPGIKTTKLSVTKGQLISNGGTGSTEGINIFGTDSKSLNITGGIIKTSSITAEQKAINNAIVFEDVSGNVIGDAEIDFDYTLLSEETLNISENTSLTIPSGKTMTIEDGATLNNYGTITNSGTIDNNGTVNTLCTDETEYQGSGTVNKAHDDNYDTTGKCLDCGEEKKIIYTAGDFTIAPTDGTTALIDGTDYSYASDALTITTTTPVTIGMKDGITKTDDIIVTNSTSGEAKITFDGINIETTEENAIELTKGGKKTTLIFNGTNTLKSAKTGIQTYNTPSIITGTENSTLNISNVQFGIYAQSYSAGGTLELGGELNLNITECTSHAIYNYKDSVTVSGTPVITIDTAQYAIYGIGIKISGGQLTLKNDDGYIICSGDGSFIEITDNADIHIQDAERGVRTNKGKVTITDKVKLKMYNTDSGNKTAAIKETAISAGELVINEDAIVDVVSITDAISGGVTTINGNALVNVRVDKDSNYSENAIAFDDTLNIGGNAKVDIDANGDEVYGFKDSSGTVNITENAVVTIDGAYSSVYAKLNMSGKASLSITNDKYYAIYQTTTISDSATLTATSTEKKVLYDEFTVKPQNGKAYMVKAGASEEAAETNYYTEETTKSEKSAWRYFHASPADVLPVTITGKDKTITYDGSKYDVSQMFSVDSNAGAATYSIAEVAGNGVGSGTLSGNELTITKAGKIKIKIETAENGTYLSGEATAVLTVNKGAVSQVSFPTASSLTYGETLENSTLTGGIGNGAFTWKDNDTIPTVTNNGYIVVFTPNDAELYDYSNIELETTVAISVSPLPINVTWNLPESLVYDGTDKAITAEVANKVGNDSLNLTIDGTTTAKDKGDYVASVTSVDNENYTLENGQNLTENWSVSETANTFTTALNITGWIFGETPNAPTATSAYGIPEYTYSDIFDGAYSTTIPTDAGTYYVKATVAGTTNYDEISDIKEFVISEKELTADNITSIAATIYTGEEIKPVIEVKDGTVPLVLDTDYTVEYQNNVNITGETKAKAVITFIGNYKGTAEKEFVINPKTINSVISLTAPVKNAVPQTSIETDEYTATVVWTPEATSNFAYSTVYTATVTITPKSNYTLTGIAENGYTFNGAETVTNAVDTGEIAVTYPATGGRSSGGGTTRYTVKFETNGGTTISNKTVTRNSELTEPTEPSRDGYTFDGWYTDKELTKAYDFDTKVTKDITLWAKWTENKAVASDPCDGTAADNCPSLAFTDLDTTAWYHLNVDYVLNEGIMNGMGGGIFAPNGNLSRAMLVTILWRLEGEPIVNYAMSFEDVDSESWYTEAIRWAASEKIVLGYSAQSFGPEDDITREQLATIIYRYEQYKGGGFVGAWMFRMDYVDLADVSDWAYEAMCWCTMNGIVNGKPGKVLDPKGTATRAEAAAIIERFIKAN